MSKKLPILVTLRSAAALRDDAILYAYCRAGFHVCLLLAVVSGVVGQCLLVYTDAAGWVSGLFAVCMVVFGFVAYFCGEKMEYPHFPRLTLDELEAMRDDMGLSPENYMQTHNNVLHASRQEMQAMETADSLLNAIKQKARSANTP